MNRLAPGLATLAMAGAIACAAPAAAEDVVIVYDASGSMWGQIDGTSKIEIAREVMADLVNGWDADTNLGLIAYGHRRKGDCTDIETLVAPGPMDKAGFIDTVNAIMPVGKTPLTEAVRQAAELLSYRDTPATVVLLSDGVETCNADPCALSAELARQGVKFTAHVVGFDLEDAAHASLSCIAENTGGMFVPAGNADELHAALAQVQGAVLQEPAAEPEPQTEPEPALPEASVTGPETVVTGAAFDVGWSDPVNSRDMVGIVPMGADDGKRGTYLRVGDKTSGSLKAPAEPGMYELRYILDVGGKTLATAPIEVVAAEASVTGPETAVTGAAFDVGWSEPVNPRDMVGIVPMGTDEGKRGTYLRVGDKTAGSLKAPSEPGMYELRYILDVGGKTLATAPIEVIAAEASVTGPETVVTGAVFDVGWSEPVNSRDMIGIVPMGTDEGKRGTYLRVGDKTAGSLKAPSEPGIYELRYILDVGGKTLATASIEVIAAEASVTGPETVVTGAAFDIGWSEPVNSRDMIGIVPMGADEGTRGTYLRVGDKTEGSLKAPSEPGMYELRYILDVGGKTLATAPIEVVETEIGIAGPGTVRAGTDVDISWSSTVHGRDMIAIVPMGADEGTRGTYMRIGDKTEGRLKAPDATGMYEIRYILDVGGKTLAGIPLEVIAADAPLDEGAGLSVPETAAPGETVTVSWTGGGDGADQRISLARKDQPLFGWISAHPVGEADSMELKMPEEPGLYEVRFLDISGQEILGRSVVEVK